jgi:hypothetical protein
MVHFIRDHVAIIINDTNPAHFLFSKSWGVKVSLEKEREREL